MPNPVQGGNGTLGTDGALCFNEVIFCNHGLFSQMTEREEQTFLLTSSLFRKRPLVVTVKRKLMLHLEIKLKQSKLKSLSQKTAASVKS